MKIIKNCPLCGHKSLLESWPSRKGFETNISCTHCLVSLTTITYETEERAIEMAINEMKRYLPWLKEADSQALKYSCRQLNDAFTRFFRKARESPDAT